MNLIEVSPVIPAALGRLSELASNLSYSWHRPTRALFEDLDQNLWRETHSNPRLLLRCVSQSALDAAAADGQYLRRYQQVLAAYDSYQSQQSAANGAPLVAYFCAEYGLHESFPIYSGGLGILAGDHCKAASDEQLNFVAVGLLYRQGYSRRLWTAMARSTPAIAMPIRATCRWNRCAIPRATGSACRFPSPTVR